VLPTFGFLSLALLVLLVVAALKPGRVVEKGLALAWQQGRMLLVRMPLSFLAAGFLIEIMPRETVGAWIGADSGLTGILVAVGLGTLIPSGPMVMFPVALVFLQVGAGTPQIVAFITAWALLAVHRVLLWEVPIVGANFAMVRVASSVALPALAAITAGIIAAAVGR
jgi:uncharacterized membrane protein YraQ (UPF0718 family)